MTLFPKIVVWWRTKIVKTHCPKCRREMTETFDIDAEQLGARVLPFAPFSVCPAKCWGWEIGPSGDLEPFEVPAYFITWRDRLSLPEERTR